MNKDDPDEETDEPQEANDAKGIWVFYTSSASIHGIGHVREPHFYSFRKWLWLFLVFSMSTGLCIILFQQIKRLCSFPTRTSMRAEFQDTIPFPAVTLCNLNQFYRSRVPDDSGLRHLIKVLSEYNSLVSHSKDNRQTVPPDTTSHFSSPNVTSTPENVANSSSASLAHSATWSNITGPELLQIVWNTAHRNSEFLYLCTWNDQVVPCEEMFEARMTDLGVCFTFNGKEGEKRKISSTFGSWTGLRVLMVVGQDQYYYSKTMQTGVKVVLHEPSDEPIPSTSGMSLRPGVSAHLAFTRTEHLGLSSPYKAFKNEYCVDTLAEDYQHKLHRYSFYSEMACYRDCLVGYVESQCNCSSPFEPEVDRPVCSVDQMIRCYTPISKSFTHQDIHGCVCKPPCRRVLYDIKASYADFASDFMEQVNNKRQNRSEEAYLRRNVVDIRVFLDSLLVVRVLQEPEMTFTDVLGTLGGHLGLFLGASILSITELTEMLLLLLLRCCGCLRNVGRRTENGNNHRAAERRLSMISTGTTKRTQST